MPERLAPEALHCVPGTWMCAGKEPERRWPGHPGVDKLIPENIGGRSIISAEAWGRNREEL